MENLSLVLGASGHLGNNLVRNLLQNGHSVRAGVRSPENELPFKGLDCEIIKFDLLDKSSLQRSMKDIDVLFVAAAVYKSWAVNIKKEIMEVNIQGTRNVMEAAAEAGIKKVIYISTSLAANHTQDPINAEGWNTNYSDPYRASKTEAEKLAWDLAKKHHLWMISILPSALAGLHSYGHLTPSMEILQKILKSQIPIDPDFYFNYIDIEDAVNSIRIAVDQGINGERYILCQDSSISSSEIFKLAHSIDSNVTIPKKVPYYLMLLTSNLMNVKSKFTNRQPLMLPSQVKSFYRANKSYDTSKAKRDLAFNPRSQIEVLREVMQLMKSESQAF